MNHKLRHALNLIYAAIFGICSMGCTTRSFPGTYKGGLDLGGMSFPENQTIGVCRFQDMRPQVALSQDPAQSYIGQFGALKIGLTHNSIPYIPVNELVHDLLLSELKKLGAQARKLNSSAPAPVVRSLQVAGREGQVDYALGGQIMAFEFAVNSGLWTVDGIQSVTFSLTMVKVNGPTLFENKLFSDSRRENEGMGVMFPALVDKLLNIALKNVLRQLVQEMALATSDQVQNAKISVSENDMSGGRQYRATIELPQATWRPSVIAVANLEALGIAQDEALVLAENVRSSLVDTGYFQVISRADMEQLLKEQSFHRSGACDDTQCLVEMGKLLLAEKIVGGSAGKAGGMFSITLRMVDVESGKIEFTTYEDIDNPKNLLPAARALSRRLALKYREGMGKDN